MITLCLLLAFFCFFYAIKQMISPSVDPSGLHFKDPKKIVEYKKALSKLEGFSYKSKMLSASDKALNLFPSDSALLDSFNFSNGRVSLRMRDGRTLEGDLINLTSTFTALNGDNVNCKVTNGSKTIEFMSIWHLYTDEEWYDIFNCLTWSGTTYRAGDYIAIYNKYHSKTGKALRYANVLMKGIKLLN